MLRQDRQLPHLDRMEVIVLPASHLKQYLTTFTPNSSTLCSLLFSLPLADDGRLPSACRPLHLRVAGGGVAARGLSVGGADWRVDGPLPGRIRVGRFGAGVQPASLVHGPGSGVPAGRR